MAGTRGPRLHPRRRRRRRARVLLPAITFVATATAVRAKYFGTNRPASTLVGVTRLASPEYKVEIEATAHLPGGIRLLKR